MPVMLSILLTNVAGIGTLCTMDTENESMQRDKLVDVLLSGNPIPSPPSEHQRLRREVEALPLASVTAMTTLLQQSNGSRTGRVAAATFVFSGSTDEIAFMDVPRRHAGSIDAVRSVEGYDYPDFLLAPPRVLAEARLLAAMNDLCAADYMRSASQAVTESKKGKLRIVDARLIRLVQQHLNDGDLILSIMSQRKTCDPEFIADLLNNPVRPLMEGSL